jgi:hypothetical protein
LVDAVISGHPSNHELARDYDPFILEKVFVLKNDITGRDDVIDVIRSPFEARLPYELNGADDPRE